MCCSFGLFASGVLAGEGQSIGLCPVAVRHIVRYTKYTDDRSLAVAYYSLCYTKGLRYAEVRCDTLENTGLARGQHLLVRSHELAGGFRGVKIPITPAN